MLLIAKITMRIILMMLTEKVWNVLHFHRRKFARCVRTQLEDVVMGFVKCTGYLCSLLDV